MVDRYDNWGKMERDGDGAFVMYSDYAALKAENERLTARATAFENMLRQAEADLTAERALAERAGGVKALECGGTETVGLKACAEFGGDLPAMQALYDRPDHLVRIAELEAEVERLTRERDDLQNRHDSLEHALDGIKARSKALSRTGAVKVIDPRHFDILVEAMAEAKATSDGLSDQPIADIVQGCIDEIAALEPAAPEGQQEVAEAVELSENTGELIDKMAEAIRGDTTSDDTPWATLSEDRKVGWRSDAERALAVVKGYLTARRPAEQAVTDTLLDLVSRAREIIPDHYVNWHALASALAQKEGKG